MNLVSRWIGAAALGAAAGLGVLAFDELLVYLTLGFEMPLMPRFILAYAGSGAVVAGLFAAWRLARRREVASSLQTVAVTAAVLYAAALAERAVQGVDGRAPQPLVVLAAAVVLVGYAAGVVVLRRIVARPPGSPGLAPQALMIGALGVGVALAINRNVVAKPFGLASLAADGAVLVAMLACAFALRGFGALRAWAPVGLGFLAAVVWQAAPSPGKPADEKAARPPHLVLVCIDTLRQDVFRAVVDETDEGRAFRDALGPAAWFDNAVAAAPWTPPSVATLLSGLYPSEHGFGRDGSKTPRRPLTRLPDSVTTLAEHLVERGYRTEAVVANPMLHPITGIGQGFERYATLQSTISKLPLATALVRAGLLRGDAYQSASTVRRLLARRLQPASAASAPLFLWLHLMDPHHPLRRHPELAPEPGAGNLDSVERLYRGEVRYALKELIRMLAMLEARSYWDDTLFVLVSDHGEMFPSDRHAHLPPDRPTAVGHGHALYDELVRVPLVIRPPGGLPAERHLDVLASHADLHDTIGDLLDLDIPRIAHGRLSLAPWLASRPRETAPPRRRFALVGGIHQGPEQRAVRTDSHKLIHFPNGEMTDELYDVGRDPGEQKNLVTTETEMLTELRELLAFSWSQLRDSPDDVGPLEVDEETRRRLKALGYLR